MRKILVFIILIFASNGEAQEAPENFKFNSMITANEFPAGNATGNPEISIPLYSIKTVRDLNIDLNLQYTLEGSINTNILGSQFGDAWNLTHSGIITRETFSRFQTASYPYNSEGYVDFDEKYYERNPLITERGTNSDLYSFDVMGLHGKFIIKKSFNSFVAEVIESNDLVNIFIYTNSSIETSSLLIDKIEIRDKNGMLYTFSLQTDIFPNIFATTKSTFGIENPISPYPDELPGGFVKNPGFDPNIESGPNNNYVQITPGPNFWQNLMLTKINDKNGRLLVEITYDQPSVILPDPSTQFANGISNYSLVTKAYLKELKIINKGSIYFNNYISSSNRNFTNSYVNSIQIKDLKGVLIKEFQFSYDNFERTYIYRPCTTCQGINYYFKKKLLKSIKEFNTDKSLSNNTTINYNTSYGDKITSYGYYINSATTATSTVGSIQSIKYPTGGTIQYQFESHDYFSDENVNLYGRGLRIKRIAHFLDGSAANSLYTNPNAVNAEQLITFDYKDHNNINNSSGRVRYDIQYAIGGYSIDQNAISYQKVKVSKRGVGYKEDFYNIIPKGSSINNSNYIFYSRQLQEDKTFDINGSLLNTNNYEYQYSFLNNVFNTIGYYIKPFVVSQDLTSSIYENSNSYTQSKNTNYNIGNRQISSTTTIDNLGKVSTSQFDYGIKGNMIVNTQQRNYINNNIIDQISNTYGTTGDLIKTEFKTPEMSTYEKVGNENNKYIGGLLRGYVQPDGTPVTLVYGYLDTHIIAKLINVDANLYYDSPTYQTIRSNLDIYSTQWHANYSEANLKSTLNTLRTSFPNAMVSTYTYKPMVGISSITDENGKETTYEYDSFNRLATVKDYLGNILKEYKYNFTN